MIDSRTIFDSLYAQVNGMTISDNGRSKLPYHYSGHTYGEVTYEDFSQMLTYAAPRPGEVFYDFGSGTGKPVIIASLLFDFYQLTGLEIIKDLNDAANQVLTQYSNLYKTPLKKDHQHIRFLNRDFKIFDFSDADIIFISATCLRYEINREFVNKLESLKKGARIITSTYQLTSNEFAVKELGLFPFTLAEDYAFLHEKI